VVVCGIVGGLCPADGFLDVDRAGRAAAWVYRKARNAAAGDAPAPLPGAIALDPPSPARRQLLEQAAVTVSAVPFVAAAYGLLYGRLDVEVTRRRIRLTRLPKAFEGFRIAQLSDFHISPFMTADEIRRCVTMANGLKTDLVVLTGDYVADDPAAQGEVVQALAGLRAPYGVFGCLGNHEIYTETEDSITQLFAADGIRMLRQERSPIQSHGEVLNLIGVDYQQARFSRDHDGHLVDRYLEGSEKLVMPNMVNILLSHNPNSFDRAAELGIDLTLAGHSHGGQLSLSFVNRGLSLVRPETPYVSGWYERPGGQLYVNRGIGTTGPPIRLGARPEITVLELTRT
jgi:predicted MPP superfamily phosphohydrolase